MIRKQLYVTAAQEEQLKVRAGAQGITEAEVMRKALDAAFGVIRQQTPEQRAALEQFIATATEFRTTDKPPRAKVYDRTALRQRYWARPSTW